MTPIKLKMQAFGPYVEPVELDFKNGLRDEKIFLIHGATGAGKTTILDAISFALYGETSGKARKSDDMRSQAAPVDVLTEIDFDFELNGKLYKIHCTPRQEVPKKRGDGTKLIPENAELFCDGYQVCFRSADVTKKVTELLGFNAEQFRQVVLLPQGEFKKFLSADSNERQEILNVLFDSTPYAKVEDKLAERAKTAAEVAKDVKSSLDALQRQLDEANAQGQSPTELANKLSEAQRNVDELKKISETAQAQLTAGNVLADKFKNLRELTATLAEEKTQFIAADEALKSAQAERQLREGELPRREELKRTIAELQKFSATLDYLTKLQSTLSTEQKKLQTATDNLQICEARTKSYEERLNQRKAELTQLFGADANFVRAEQLLARARELENLQREISQHERTLSMQQLKLDSVTENYESAKINRNRLQIVHSAAHLAQHLVDGEPCPVCGSREHPAVIAEAIPTAAELDAAEAEFKRSEREKSQHERTIDKLNGELDALKNRLPDFADVPDVPTAQARCDEAKKLADALKQCQANIDKGEKFIAQNRAALDKAVADRNKASNAVERIEGEIAGRKSDIPEIYLADGQKLADDLKAAQTESDTLDKAWKVAQDEFNDASKNFSACEATVQTVQKNFDALDAELKGKTQPDVAELTRAANTSSDNLNAAIDERAKLENTLTALKKVSADLADVEQKFTAAQNVADMWRRLSDVANATGKGEAALKISFQRYYLSTMFNEVVNEANNRLSKMSGGRYTFRQKDAGNTRAKSAGLNLEILDEFSGRTRPVETLSGGESFLASLALALGLASVVQNRSGGINLDTIFIDEGFGTLDSETLDFAISTIIEQSGGRLVGIISHVEELKRQIPVRLEVTKTKIGSKAKFVS